MRTQTGIHSYCFKWHALSQPATCHREARAIYCGDAQLNEVYLLVCIRVRGLILVFYPVDFVKKEPRFIHGSLLNNHLCIQIDSLPGTWPVGPRSSKWFKCNWQVLWWSRHFLPLDCHSCLMNLHTPPQSAWPPFSSHPFNLLSSIFPLITYLLWSLLYWALSSVILISGELILMGNSIVSSWLQNHCRK